MLPLYIFLRTRTKRSDIEDWKNLKQQLCFLVQTVDDEIIIGACNLNEMQTSIDSLYIVHDDMRGHTGVVTTFGTGILSAKSSQKINSKSSTKSEVIGNSKYLPFVIWYE